VVWPAQNSADAATTSKFRTNLLGLVALKAIKFFIKTSLLL